MRALSLEGRVGLFVLGALVVLAGFVLALGDVSLARRFTALVDFAYAGSLREGAPVKVSGLRIGRVSNVSLLSPDSAPPPALPGSAAGTLERPWIRVELRLDEAARPLLTSGARITVGMQGVIGDAYLELTPGEPGGAPLSLSQAHRGVDAPALHVMALQMATLLDLITNFGASEAQADTAPALAALLRTLNDLLGSEKAQLAEGLRDLSGAAKELRVLLADVHAAIGDDKLSSLVHDAGVTAQAMQANVPGLLRDLEKTFNRVDALSARAEQGLDPEALTEIVQNLRKAARTLEAVSRDGQALVQGIERGEGSVGGLVKNPQLYDDLKELLRDLKRNPWKLLWRD